MSSRPTLYTSFLPASTILCYLVLIFLKLLILNECVGARAQGGQRSTAGADPFAPSTLYLSYFLYFFSFFMKEALTDWPGPIAASHHYILSIHTISGIFGCFFFFNINARALTQALMLTRQALYQVNSLSSTCMMS